MTVTSSNTTITDLQEENTQHLYTIFFFVLLAHLIICSLQDGELPRVSPRLSRTADALRVVHDVLLREEWFVERPPLALAVIHPLTRLHCEMWRAHCVGPLSFCPTTATSYHTHCATAEETEAGSAEPSSSSLYVRVGDATVANPAAPEDPPLRGAAGFTRPSLASPSTILAASPFTSSLPFRDVCSLIPPLTSVDACGATSPQTQGASWAQLRRRSDLTPVINPSTPLYSLETYSEKVFKLPVGMKLGHVRIITTALPVRGRAEMELVRGFYAHVPAASTLSAAHRAAAAVRDAAAALTKPQRAVIRVSETAPSTQTPTRQQEQQHAPVVESDSDGTTSGAGEREENNGGGDADALLDDEEDDWETAALLEEARLEEESRQRALKSTAAAAATASVGAPSASNGVRVGTSPAPPRHDNTKEEALSTLRPSPDGPSVKLAATPSVTRVDDLESTPSSTSAVLNSVVTVLPPPCAWWLRRRLTAVGGVSTAAAAPSVPLFVHCIEATRQWATWVDELQRADRSDKCATAVSAGDGSADLRGVSLSGWSTAYVPDTLISPDDLRHRSGIELFIEEALPLTLPLRGLHLETFLSIAVAVLERGVRSPGIWRDSLVALDLPHLRNGLAATKVANAHASPSLSRALAPLRGLRYLSLNRSSTEVSLSGAAATYEDDGESDGANAGVRSLEELRLFCVPGLSAPSLAAVGRHGGFLRMVDLSSTAITEQDLAALVWGTMAQDDQDGPDATSPTAAVASAAVAATQQSSPLVFLEELRLAACHSLLRLRPLPALPSLRRLTLQASGVRQLDDLVGCNALEELVLTRCEHVRALHPLWRLPHLRCVEADGVRQLQLESGLLPPPPAHSTRYAVHREDEALQDSLAEVDEALLAAPLSRLNLSQASLVHGPAVGRLATALRDISGRLRSLTVLLLDHTAINDDAVEALAGLSSASGSSRGGTTTTAANVAATGLRELSVAGCLGVHHLGPLGLLPQLARVVADGSGVEHLDGLERSTSLTFLSLAHCGRVWSIAALAALSTLRTLDVSRTPLNDAGLLRFVFPDLVRRLVSRQLRGEAPVDDDTAASIASCIAAVVPSQVEELRLYQCTALRYLGCLAHLPRLRRLDVSDTAVFDRGFVGFFANPLVLLRVQLWAAGAADGGTSWTVDEQGGGAGRRAGEMAMAPIPDEVALLRAWRRRWALTTASAGDGAVTSAHEFVFGMGAAQTLGHVSLAYCAEVRGITSYALFHRLATLDLSGTAVDSAALLAFVNILHECCKAAGAGGNESDPHLSLVMERDGLRASPLPNAGTGASVVSSTSQRCYTLTSLTLSFCHYLTDVRCCATVPSLRNLTLCGMAIDNAAIDALAAPPPLPPTATTLERRWWRRHQCALRFLDIRYCRGVTDVSPLLVQQQQAGTLEELHLSHSGVTMSKAELRALNPYSRCRITA